MKAAVFCALLLGMTLTPRLADAAPPSGGDHALGWAQRSTAGMALSPDASKLAVAGTGGVKIYSTSDGAMLETRETGAWMTKVVAWAPDGTLAAGGTTVTTHPTGLICLWKNGTPQGWTVGQNGVASLAFSPDSQTLASVEVDSLKEAGPDESDSDNNPGYVRFYEVNTRRLKRAVKLPHSAVTVATRFSPDGKRFAFSTEAMLDDAPYGTITLDASTGKVLKRQPNVFRAPLLFSTATGFPLTDAVVAQTRLPDGITARLVRRPKTETFSDYGPLQAQIQTGKNGAFTPAGNIGGDGACAFMQGDIVVASLQGEGSFYSGNDTEATLTNQVVGIWHWKGKSLRRVATIGQKRLGLQALQAIRDGELLAMAAQNQTFLWSKTEAAPRIIAGPPIEDEGDWDVLSPYPPLFVSEAGDILFDGRLIRLTPQGERIVLDLTFGSGLSENTRALSRAGEGSLSPDGRHFAANNGMIDVFSRRINEVRVPSEFGDEEEDEDLPRPKAEIGTEPLDLHDQTWSRDSAWMAACVRGNSGATSRYRVFDAQGKTLFESKESAYSTLAFGPRKEELLVAAYDQEANRPELSVRDSLSGKKIRTFALPETPAQELYLSRIARVATSPDGQGVGVFGLFWTGQKFDAQLLIFDYATGKLKARRSMPPVLWSQLESGTPVFTWLDNTHLAALDGEDRVALLVLDGSELRTESLWHFAPGRPPASLPLPTL